MSIRVVFEQVYGKRGNFFHHFSAVARFDFITFQSFISIDATTSSVLRHEKAIF